jgi:AraC family transcriptional regulator
VEEGLDQSLRLTNLARRSGFSPFHFHRRFVSAVGETPVRHVMRLRMERAAYLLAVTDDPVLSTAIQVGFTTHETFSRAFRRHFGTSPTGYRDAAKRAQDARRKHNADFAGDACRLSAVRVIALPALQLLAVRRTGPYDTLPLPPFGEHDAVWAPLAAWARQSGVAVEQTPWVICHDDPTVTPGRQQRLDACLPLLERPSKTDVFQVRPFAGGLFAGAEHVGPHATIDQAYRHVADGIRRLKSVFFADGPPVQIFRHVDPTHNHHRTEVYFPVVVRRGAQETSSSATGPRVFSRNDASPKNATDNR